MVFNQEAYYWEPEPYELGVLEDKITGDITSLLLTPQQYYRISSALCKENSYEILARVQ